ncbi:MAG: hypothetical protein FWG07_02235 [Treponema sp.]|nr:hypothetical protein [Treponema sp.]
MKDNQSLIVFLVILGIILIAGVFCYTQLEIVPSTRWEGPSREVRANSFYALEKWLEEFGQPVKTLTTGNVDTILNGSEKIIFLETSCFSWNKNPELLIPWLEEGNQLIISLDNYINYRLRDFMEFLDIATVSSYNYDETVDKTDTFFIIEEEKNEDEDSSKTKQEQSPYFDWHISFKRADPDAPLRYKTFVMNNNNGITKLVKFEIGKGSLIFTGTANFLKNYALHEKQNVDLAADIFLGNMPEDKQGILFIRSLSGNKGHLLGNLAERGNPAALIISLVLLIITGFWMVIPLFGRYRPAPEKPGKPLHERFLAEGRFLKKNHALGKYIEVYEKELEQKRRSKGIASAATNSLLKEITFVQFLNNQKKLMEQLEELNKEKL